MSTRMTIVSVCLILGGSALSIWRDLRTEAEHINSVTEWALAHKSASARSSVTAAQSPYWRWRALPEKNRLEHLAKADPMAVFSAGAGQEVWAINAAAGRKLSTIPTTLMPLISISTASLLGVEIDDDPEVFRILSEQIVGGLNPWREAMAQRCGDCAPPAAPFPAPAEPMGGDGQGLNARPTTGISITVERYRRTVIPMLGKPSRMAAMVKRIREGGAPTAQEWATPGLAGMAALELGARGDRRWTTTLLQAAKTGPSGTDQIAALWAARLLGAQDPLLQQVEAAL